MANHFRLAVLGLTLLVCSLPAAADEGLFVVGDLGSSGPPLSKRPKFVGKDFATGMVRRYPRASTWLYFPRTGELQRNNLLPPTPVGAKVEGWLARGSSRGRLFLGTVETARGKRLMELRMVSPFRNLPYNQTTPFRRYPVGPKPLQTSGYQLGPPGYQIVYPAWSTDGMHLAYQHRKATLVHHKGGGELFRFTDPQKRRQRFGALPGTFGHAGKYPDKKLYAFALPRKRGSYSTASFRTRALALEDGDVPMLHLSPDGRRVARVIDDNKEDRLLIGPVGRLGVVWSRPVTRRDRGRTVTIEDSRVSPIGWSQDGSMYVFAVEHERRITTPSGIGPARYGVMSSKLMAWKPGRGVQALMDLPYSVLSNGLLYQAPMLVDETKRYVALWGRSNADRQRLIPYKDYSRRKDAKPVKLVVADLQTRRTREVLTSRHALDMATWIKTQEGDDTNPKPAHTPPPQLPQYFLEVSAPQVKTLRHVNLLEMNLEGKAIDLADTKREFAFGVRFQLADGRMLRDIDQVNVDAKGLTYFQVMLKKRGETASTTHFKHNLKSSFSIMDIVSHQPLKLRVVAELLRDGRKMVEAKSPLIEVPAARIPKVYFTKVRIRRSTNAQRVAGIRFQSRAVLFALQGQEIRIEAAGGPPKKTGGIATPNVPSERRVTYGLGGVKMVVTPTKKEHWVDVDLFLPYDHLTAARGESKVRVILRAYRGQREFLGGEMDRDFKLWR